MVLEGPTPVGSGDGERDPSIPKLLFPSGDGERDPSIPKSLFPSGDGEGDLLIPYERFSFGDGGGSHASRSPGFVLETGRVFRT